MCLFRNIIGSAIAAVVAVAASQLMAHEETVILVGRNAAGALVVDSDYTQPAELPVSIFPGISGYATGEIGMHSTVFDDPTNDFFQLSTAADFQFILLAKDPGMEVWNYDGSVFRYMATNETFYIGPSPFDTHPLWNLVNGTPGTAYSLTLKLHDLNGVYPDSDPFVLSFTPVQVHYPLSIQQTDPLNIALAWTTNAVGWELQSSLSLTATNWTTITNVPGIAGTNFSLSRPTVETQQFFRLRKP
jgi:hypothetical protein